MLSLNKTMLIGNATRDPELKYIPSGQGVCNFSIATNRRFKNAQGDIQEETQYHDLVAWGKLAELISQMVKKGNKVYVEGRLQTRQWDAPDGSKRSRTEVVLEQFVPLTPKNANGAYSDPGFGAQTDTAATATPDETQPVPSAKPAAKTTKEKPTENAAPTPAPDAEEINLDDIPF